MKVWIVKYCTTKGIIPSETNDISSKIGTIIVNRKPGDGLELDYFKSGEWMADRESAVRRAKELRKKKIASLERKIKKIKKIDFSVDYTEET